MSGQLSVPINVIRKGRAEEYVTVYTEYQRLLKESGKLHIQFADQREFLQNYHRRESHWKTALVMKDMADKLLDIAGQLSEVSAKLDDVKTELNEMEADYE